MSQIVETQHIRVGGNPLTANESELQHPGDLGKDLMWDDTYKCRRIKVDSGATASAPYGAVAARNVAYWKDEQNSLVTNDQRFAQGGQNGVAGIFPVAITAGYYGFIVRDSRVPYEVMDGSTAFVASDTAIAKSASDDVDRVAAGTATPYQRVGVATGASGSGALGAGYVPLRLTIDED